MRSFLLYAEATLLTLVILFAALDLRHADLRIPLYYSMGSDVHFILGMIKSVADTGWYFENPWLGAPGTLKIYDFPFAETGTFLGVKLFLLLFRDPYLAGNLFYLATYVLASWTLVVRTAEVRSPGPGGRGGEPPVRVHALPSLERHGASPPLRVLPDPSGGDGEPVAMHGQPLVLRHERAGPRATGLA